LALAVAEVTVGRVLPSLDNLRCFLAAAEHLNFRRASRQVALTPAAFGQRIRQLEDCLEVKLFERTTRSVRLTAEGDALIPAAREAVRAAQKCASAVLNVEERPLRLTLGTRFELGMSWIVPMVVELNELRPLWTLELYFGSGTDLLERLRSGVIDAVVTSAPVARSEWHQEVLHAETYVFCATPTYLEAHPFRGAEDAGAHSLLDINHTQPLSRYVLSVGPPMTFRNVRACGTAGAVCALVEEGLGVAVVPEYMVRAELNSGQLIPLLPEVELLRDAFRMLWREGSPDAEALTQLAQHFRSRPLPG
jgi:DNA-binding transcriptional LysR family regulator